MGYIYYLLFVFLSYTPCLHVKSFEFNREFVGVNFSPYVKRSKTDISNSCMTEYTLDEIRTMLQVVTSKFSRISTETVGVLNVEYTTNYTYYKDSCIIARTAEVAANINKQNNNNTLKVLIGIMSYDDKSGGKERTLTEAKVALEAARIANEIHPGTVIGLQMFVNETLLTDLDVASNGLEWVEYLKEQTKGANLSIGIYAHISDVKALEQQQYGAFNFVTDIPRAELLQKAHFINCITFPTNEMLLNGPTETYLYMSSILRLGKALAEAIGATIQLPGSSGWPSSGKHETQTIENMQDFWKLANDFANEYKFTVWMYEAFDNPWKRDLNQDLSHYGWWRLTQDELAHDASAYVEKVLEEKPSRTLKATSSYLPAWVGVGVTVVIIMVALIFRHIVKVYREINSLQQVLTDEEMREFKFGSSVSNANENGTCGAAAMRKPYDQNLEIAQSHLEIHWDQILGSGQFGTVHKALWKGEVPKEVALKTTKADCPANALRGILSEIKILSHLGHHPNIVSICGAYTAELSKGLVYVALELCTMGCLKSRLVALNKSRSAGNVDAGIVSDLFRWSLEIASGMEHIAQMGVVHADLATRNVLLSSEGAAKIADFGLSRRLYEYSEYVKQQQDPLPWRWMAIESLKMMHFSSQSDVWSFGVTLWEIFSLGLEPYPGYSYSACFIDSLENGSAIMKAPVEATPEMYQIMLECWNIQPEMRPSFNNLKNRILEICK